LFIKSKTRFTKLSVLYFQMQMRTGLNSLPSSLKEFPGLPIQRKKQYKISCPRTSCAAWYCWNFWF